MRNLSHLVFSEVVYVELCSFEYRIQNRIDDIKIIIVLTWVDLQAVVVLVSILKQTVHGVQNLMRQQEEPFSERMTKD